MQKSSLYLHSVESNVVVLKFRSVTIRLIWCLKDYFDLACAVRIFSVFKNTILYRTREWLQFYKVQVLRRSGSGFWCTCNSWRQKRKIIFRYFDTWTRPKWTLCYSLWLLFGISLKFFFEFNVILSIINEQFKISMPWQPTCGLPFCL